MATRHPHIGRRRRVLASLERLLLLVGVLLLAYFGYVTVEARLYQAMEHSELNALLSTAPPPGVPLLEPTIRRSAPENGETIGRLEIPRLDVSTIVRAGIDTRTLQLAVGHIPGTALPGEHGNVGVAGHRDTFFRALRHIRSGDDIRFVTLDGTYTFRVDRTLVVEPEDVWVLDPGEGPMLTLVTCYPFTFMGSAPQRFIVHATQVPA